MVVWMLELKGLIQGELTIIESIRQSEYHNASWCHMPRKSKMYMHLNVTVITIKEDALGTNKRYQIRSMVVQYQILFEHKQTNNEL